MDCNEMNSKLADLLFEPETMSAEGKAGAESHLAGCANCRKELDELRATMALLDTWQAPEPNPYFLTRMNARLEEERQTAPAGWFEKLRARLTYGTRLTLRPIAATAMAAVLLVSGGAYWGVSTWDRPKPQPVQTAVVDDLQTLDSNAQLLDQLESLSDQSNDEDGPTNN